MEEQVNEEVEHRNPYGETRFLRGAGSKGQKAKAGPGSRFGPWIPDPNCLVANRQRTLRRWHCERPCMRQSEMGVGEYMGSDPPRMSGILSVKGPDFQHYDSSCYKKWCDDFMRISIPPKKTGVIPSVHAKYAWNNSDVRESPGYQCPVFLERRFFNERGTFSAPMVGSFLFCPGQKRGRANRGPVSKKLTLDGGNCQRMFACPEELIEQVLLRREQSFLQRQSAIGKTHDDRYYAGDDQIIGAGSDRREEISKSDQVSCFSIAQMNLTLDDAVPCTAQDWNSGKFACCGGTLGCCLSGSASCASDADRGVVITTKYIGDYFRTWCF